MIMKVLLPIFVVCLVLGLLFELFVSPHPSWKFVANCIGSLCLILYYRKKALSK